MQDITGTEHVDRLPVILSENNEFHLLGVPKMESGTGWNTAYAVYQQIIDWGLIENIVAICFDTTAANTGHTNGAAQQLQLLLEMDLLELACRHHVHELALKSAFESKFGKSSAPIPPLFKRFKDAWNDINQSDFEAGIKDTFINAALADIIKEICDFCKCQLKKKSVRHDYEEFLFMKNVFG